MSSYCQYRPDENGQGLLVSKKTRFTHEMGTVVQFAVGPVTLAEIQIILVIFGAFCRTLNLDEMKKFYLVIVALCISVAAHGQLQPPVQSDTLVIQSVKYNYSDIRKENWPCNIIVKSTTSFRFGDQVVNIKEARDMWYDFKYKCTEIRFRMEDDRDLSYYENGSKSSIVYSGYEFECKNSLFPMIPMIEGSSSSNGITLNGRKVVGTIAKPEYTVQESGTVVVAIWVDAYGNVVKAQPGAEGTTVDNSALWNSARKAALATHFNADADAPALQKGTIRYIFKLSN